MRKPKVGTEREHSQARGDHYPLTAGVKANGCRTSSHLPRSFMSSQWQSCDDINYQGGTSKSFEHLIRLRTRTDGHDTRMNA